MSFYVCMNLVGLSDFHAILDRLEEIYVDELILSVFFFYFTKHVPSTDFFY